MSSSGVGRAYGLYPGFPNPAELELADIIR